VAGAGTWYIDVVFGLFKKRHRTALRAEPMPQAWQAIIAKNVPFAALLPAEDARELEALVRIFIAEKRFEGCGGLTITDEMKVTIAAQACLLLLHRESDIYPDLESILVYPHAYRAQGQRRDGALVVEADDVRLGESWVRGTLILAWDHVRAATHHVAIGQNVVLHEFAHQLDGEEGAVDGAPDLGSRARYVSWARVLGDEYTELSERIHAGRESDIDPYGATSPPEFFAVVTEMFFERPCEMRKRHPALYAELAAFYRQDPAVLIESVSSSEKV
jgi:Mlc titration factor MtfA (ptsG expression regulator)